MHQNTVQKFVAIFTTKLMKNTNIANTLGCRPVKGHKKPNFCRGGTLPRKGGVKVVVERFVGPFASGKQKQICSNSHKIVGYSLDNPRESCLCVVLFIGHSLPMTFSSFFQEVASLVCTLCCDVGERVLLGGGGDRRPAHSCSRSFGRDKP